MAPVVKRTEWVAKCEICKWENGGHDRQSFAAFVLASHRTDAHPTRRAGDEIRGVSEDLRSVSDR